MSGQIILRLKTDNTNGKFEAKILGHEGGASCHDGLDEALIRDILDAEILGFGEMAQVEDGGKTNEHFEEKRQKCGKQSPVLAPFGEEDEEHKTKAKDLSLGFGV
jgi:hypothetical protein